MVSMKKVGTVAAAAGLFAASAMPAFASVNLGVGNGNTLQQNNGDVTTNVAQHSSTGKNGASSVFGGDNSVKTGDASNVAVIGTSVNSNSGNGHNVNGGFLNGNTAQQNNGDVTTNVDQHSSTGKNGA